MHYQYFTLGSNWTEVLKMGFMYSRPLGRGTGEGSCRITVWVASALKAQSSAATVTTPYHRYTMLLVASEWLGPSWQAQTKSPLTCRSAGRFWRLIGPLAGASQPRPPRRWG
eukprot:scaffold6860_cov376-Prasinococcus_capsulatus_cf.AAC.1